jgi:hypothetical protein
VTDSLDSVPMRFPRAATAALFLATLAACTTNPFLAGYSGERFPAVTAATVVKEDPAAGTATKIGSSKFVSTSQHDRIDDEARDAALAVGADMVRWDVRQLSRAEWVESDPVYQRRASGRGQFASYIPIPGTSERWQYAATFWRAVSAPPEPPAPQPPAATSARP